MDRAVLRRQFAAAARISKERNRRLALHQDQMLQSRKHRLGGLREIRQPQRRHAVSAASIPRSIAAAEYPDAGRRCQMCRRFEPRRQQCAAAQQQPGGFPGPQNRSRLLNTRGLRIGRGETWQRRPRLTGITPGEVRGHNQRSHLPGCGAGGLHGGRRLLPDVLRASHGANIARNGARQRLDVGRERRVVAQVLRAVLAYDGHHRRPRLASIVKIGESVG